MLRFSRFFGDLIDGPFESGTQSFFCDSATGLADGHQPAECPRLRTALFELNHEQAVRQHDQVHVPGLALAVTKLTVSHAQLLLAVPMVGLGACPATTIAANDACDFPLGPIGDQYFGRSLVSAIVPQNHDSHLVIHVWQTNRAGEIPLSLVATAKLLAIDLRNGSGKILCLDLFAFETDLAIEFQVTDVSSRLTMAILFAMNVVEIRGTGKIAVKREITRDVPFADPIDQLSEQDPVILECLTRRFALLPLLKATKLQRVMFATAGHVVGEQIIVSNLVPFFGMIPKPADVFDQLVLYGRSTHHPER